MKEYWNIQFGYRGAEVYYVPVDKQTMHFWKYQWNSYLERYAFDHDPFGRQEVREYLKNHLMQRQNQIKLNLRDISNSENEES